MPSNQNLDGAYVNGKNYFVERHGPYGSDWDPNQPPVPLDPQGDATIVLDGKRFRVSTKVMSLTSPVFRAMFGPN